LETLALKSGPGGPKKDSVVLTMATEGPAARKLLKKMAQETSTAM
jgi:hypothetical protein